mmetsp:Transcript_5110/g.18412  ORF Transcript_5110/g.18412 Transcript_5110/m.18412 type:complete len:158 (-) Transcript_5110:1898-2371(-)
MWALSNIAAGSDTHVRTLIDFGCISEAIKILVSDSAAEVRKEALWVVCNATEGKATAHMRSLVSAGAIEALAGTLDIKNPPTWLCVALEGMSNILAAGAGPPIRGKRGAATAANRWLGKLEACGGLERVEALQKHADVGVYERALLLLATFFDVSDV